MDQNSIYQLFVATYNPDPNVHKQAELSIRSIEAQNGFLPVVLQIFSSEQLELGARQAAAIYFKNRIYRAWERGNNSSCPIGEEDRNIVKQGILHALVTVPNAVQVQLATSLYTILDNDFPDQWPNFVNEVQSFLSSNDARLISVGLLALREVVKVYQWKDTERREPLQHIIELTFPTVQGICNNLVTMEDLDAAIMLKTSLKIYHASIQVDLPKSLQESKSLVPWGTLFLQLIEKRIPMDCLPETIAEREAYPWGKAKKWAYHCLNRLFGKYGNPALLPPGSATRYNGFAKNFVNNFAPNIIQAYLTQVDGWIKKELWMSNKCLMLTAAFLDDSIKHKTTWQIMKPHTDVLVSQFIFPQLCISLEDEQLWQNDPVDYVHKKIDPLEDFHSPQINVTNMLIDLAHHRKKHTFMGILGFINNVLMAYLETSEGQKNGREKDGALAMIGSLANEILAKKSPVANMMDAFFVTHVFPDFKSRFPYLRARACDITRKFSNLDFSSEENVLILYENVLECLRDSELPVKVQAALALQPMIRHETVRNAMEPSLPFIMQELLNLTNEIDVDILATVMEEFVEIFAVQLTPFAVQLCTQLRDTYLRIMEEISQAKTQNGNGIEGGGEDEVSFNGDIDELSDKMMAAMGVLKTIGTLILSLESSPEVLQQLEDALLPVITYTLENSVMDLYVEIFEIIDSCTFSAKRVTPTMWGVFELIYKALKDTTVDFMAVLPPLDNYISYGRDVFIAHENFQQMMFDIIQMVMKGDHLTEEDKVSACKLMESVLLNCRGHMDSYVMPFLNLAFQYIFTGTMKSLEFKIHCLEVVINCLYYNPALTLRILEDNHWTQGFFSLWFGLLDKFSRVHDKKLVIVTLCAILELPSDQIPHSLQSGWSHILNSIIMVFKSLPKAIENRENMEKLYGEDYEQDIEESSGYDGSSTGDDDTVENDDEDVHDEDNEYLEFLTQQAAAQENDGLEFDEEDEIEEEVLFESPLDEIDPYIKFDEIFRKLQGSSPESYTLLTKDLDGEKQDMLLSILNTAEQNRNALYLA
ncbi:armadillo-type protein [Halteromyces radiatus]|uniref:armadillo-type protein n=1 Tax=Halteromyces radiatus TaxID=101107 RepID=UPI00221ED08E|nr:armadillo-type protein [Halteromyces radiatus]KAI8097286.1 armadillo-type protein [Halteromyces radiatus]